MRTQIVFLVLPQVHLLDLAGADQVFFEAKAYGANISIQYCSSEGSMNTSSSFPLGSVNHFSKVSMNRGDFLFIPGSDVSYLLSKEMAGQHDLFAWIRQQHDNGVQVCSVCTGAFVLGHAKLLNGRKCTTHWKRTEQLKKKFPAIKLVEDILFTEDGGIYTSAGVTAGIDLALFVLGKLADDNLSYKVARGLVVYLRRKGSDAQQSVFMRYRNHIHSGVHKAQDFLQQNIQRKLSIDELADAACMSTRTFTRTFKKETGITVNEYTTLLRQERLREFSKKPDISRKQMAQACGLKSERQVLRLLNAIKTNN